MDRTERFCKITELLRTNQVVSFATLLARLEVSRSTLKRDLNYLDAWCHYREQLRNFALDAINQVVPLDEPARDVSAAQLSATFGPGYDIFSGGKLRWARLRFSPERARWVAQEQWHAEQRGKFEPDGSYLLPLPYTDHRELIMDILKHGAHCEVLGPPSLRQVVRDEVKKMGEKYF